MDSLFEKMPSLKRLFPTHISVFPTAAFNFGPNVWTHKHRDSQNCPFGWCSIQALGNFDHTQGGQLILWEPKLVVDFPSGTVILLPSSIITHSNTPVVGGETRASFTQYATGGLFRYVDHQFHTKKEFKERYKEMWQEISRKGNDNWKQGYDLLYTLDELKRKV